MDSWSIRALRRTAVRISLLVAVLVSGCSTAGGELLPPSVDEFSLSPEDEAAVEDATAQATRAAGRYVYSASDGRIEIDFSDSTFVCDGPPAGQYEGIVETITPHRITVRLDGDDEAMEWVRLSDEDSGLVGVWELVEDEDDGTRMFLIVSSDGSLSIVSEGTCEAEEELELNAQGCLELDVSSQPIVVDGEVADWSEVESRVADPHSDHMGTDQGADITGMRLSVANDVLYILVELSDAPSTAFQAREPPYGGYYELRLLASSGHQLNFRVAYAELEQEFYWVDQAGVQAAAFAVGATSLEFSIPLSATGGDSFDRIVFMANTAGEVGQSFTGLDETELCAAF